MKNCLTYLSSALLLLFSINTFASTPDAVYCGYDPGAYFSYYPVFNQQLLKDASLYPFLHCKHVLCDDGRTVDTQNQNLKEWQEFLGNSFSEAEVRTLVYKNKAEWYAGFLVGKSTDKLAKKLNTTKGKAFARYMELALACENISSNASGGTGWRQGEEKQKEDQKPVLLQKSLELAQEETNPFLKNRYGFQIVRLDHYMQYNEKALAHFREFMELTPQTHYIYYRSLEQRSGAAYNLEKWGKAAQGYLEVYAHLPSRRRVCSLSLFGINWNDLNNSQFFEKAGGYSDIKRFFKIFYASADLQQEAVKMSEETPDSPYLSLVAVRTADKIQQYIFHPEGRDDGFYYSSQKQMDKEALQTLTTISQKQLKNPEVKQQSFWHLMRGIALLGDEKYEEAENEFASAKASEEIKRQAERLQFAVSVARLQKIDRRKIEELYKKFKNDSTLYLYPPLTAYFFNHISKLYDDQGNVLMGTLSYWRYDGYTSSEWDADDKNWQNVVMKLGDNSGMTWKHKFLNAETLKGFKALVYQKNKTAYEKLILSQLKTSPEDYYNDLQGTYYLAHDRLDEAIASFQKLKKPEVFYKSNYRPAVFGGAIHEYFDTPFRKQADSVYKDFPKIIEQKGSKSYSENYTDNKLALAKTLKKLEVKATKNTKNAATYNYLLGNAFYNMSVRGWFVNTLFYNSNDARNHLRGWRYGDENQKNDASALELIAGSYYQKAVKNKTDNEIGAKATFMLAKINYCYDAVDAGSGWQRKVVVCGEHEGYFEQLNTDFSETQFQKEVIKECSWYRSYLEDL